MPGRDKKDAVLLADKALYDAKVVKIKSAAVQIKTEFSRDNRKEE